MIARRPLVGWYLHHSGAGHRTRFDAVRAHLDADVVVFSTLAPPPALPSHTRWTMLDRDDQPERTESGVARDPAQSQPTAGGALHWAPLGHSGHASRLGMIAAALASERFDAFVVDVSVEVTLLVRLFGVPAVVMTQPGERNDDPHRLAFTAASRIVAPWPEALYVPRALEPFRAKTAFVGGISRFAGRRAAAPAALDADASAPGDVAPAPTASVPGLVLVLGAGGGRAVTPADVEAAAVATRARPVSAAAGAVAPAASGSASIVDEAGRAARVEAAHRLDDAGGGAGARAGAGGGAGAHLGAGAGADAGATVWHALGTEATEHVSAERWNADPFDLLRSAEVIVSFAGQNAVADLAAVGARAIVIAQPRAFDEQRATAGVLQEHGLAVARSSWPSADEWPALLAEARASTPDWSAWLIPGAAARAAAVIADVAAQSAQSAPAGVPHPESGRSDDAIPAAFGVSTAVGAGGSAAGGGAA